MKFIINGLWPDPSKYSATRLFCLDLMRGIIMFYLVLGDTFLSPVLRHFHVSEDIRKFLNSHPWEGFMMWDAIMPFFIFMAGASVPFALGKRLDQDGKPGPGYWSHVWFRVILLWVLGMMAQGCLLTLDLHKWIPYSNTLQTIAVGYLAAAWLYPMRNKLVKILFPISMVVIYGLLIHCFGDYTKDGNLAQRIDLAVWGWLLPADSIQIESIKHHGYAWLLPSMMFPVLALGGCYATELLKSGRAAWQKVQILAASGVVLAGLGWGLHFAGVNTVKHIFTVSFTLKAVGYAQLMLCGLYILTDIWQLRRGTGFLLLFGQFALTTYLCVSIFYGDVRALGVHLFGGLKQFMSPGWQEIFPSLAHAVMVFVILVLYRQIKLRCNR